MWIQSVDNNEPFQPKRHSERPIVTLAGQRANHEAYREDTNLNPKSHLRDTKLYVAFQWLRGTLFDTNKYTCLRANEVIGFRLIPAGKRPGASPGLELESRSGATAMAVKGRNMTGG